MSRKANHGKCDDGYKKSSTLAVQTLATTRRVCQVQACRASTDCARVLSTMALLLGSYRHEGRYDMAKKQPYERWGR